MVEDHNRQFTAGALAVSFAFLSLLASLLTLLLIHRLDKWNGYIQLVVSLTACQILYDISFFFLPLVSTWGDFVYLFLNTLGGLTSSLWSNVIIIVTARIVIRLRTVDTLKKYPQYLALVTIPSVAIAASVIAFYDHAKYDYVIICYFIVRSVSIVVNLAAIAIIFFKISLMHGPSPTSQKPPEEETTRHKSHERVQLSHDSGSAHSLSTSHNHAREAYLATRQNSSSSSNYSSPAAAPKSNPVFLLSKRLVYYCIVQTITRIGSTWYQIAYGFGSEYEASDASTLQTIIYLSEFVLSPSAGIGYLVVFLLIQPEAWLELRSMLGCPPQHRQRRRHRRKQSRVLSLDSTQAEEAVESSAEYRGSRRYDGLPSEHSEDVPEDEFDSVRETNNTLSSNDSSLFPLLDQMTEDDLAREIERQYNPQYFISSGQYHDLSLGNNDQKTPLIRR